jgi:uncharacterized protein (TIGR03000 family)
MFRAAVALLSAVSFAHTARAQPGLPLSPGVHPGSSIGPGTQFVPQAGPRFVPPRAPAPVVPCNPFPPLGYGFFGPLAGFGPYYNPYATPLVVIVEAPPAAPAFPPEPGIVLANEFPATLSVQFPAAARVWLNGTEVGGAAKAEFAFESAALPQGASHTFELKARWEQKGKTYEAARTVRVRAGDRSKLIVVSGTEVRE